ncbi:TlpA family protein disulfide reductase [Roseibium sp.]|uniref:TlpA family protein disulfide reductase n=1 Tax=Roseibium sp. TaxID=1936156 RepID=UPI003B50A86D
MVEIDRRSLLAALTLLLASGHGAFANADRLRRLGLAEPPIAIRAPELNVPDLQGALHRVEDYRGKITVVSFWATWCPPCRKEMPALARLSRELDAERFAVLAVNVGDKEDKIRSFLEKIDHAGLPILMDTGSELPSKWYIHGLPVTYVLDADGQVVYGALGERVWDSPDMVSGLKSLG